MLDALTGALGDALVASELQPGRDLWVRVTPEAWREAALACRDVLRLEYFGYVSAIDWLPSPFGRGEDDPSAPPPVRSTAIEQGVTGGATRFQVLARLASIRHHTGVTLKADVPEPELAVPSWTPVYAGADWPERETWEMFGIVFDGHPNLRHLYLPGDFEGFPLRKDFPLLSRLTKPWPGIVDVEPMPAGSDDEGESGSEE